MTIFEGTIRQAKRNDASSIAAIYAHHVLNGTATFDTDPPGPAAMVEKIDHCLSKGWPFLVAERDGVILGYAYATQFRDRDAYRYACENSIYINVQVLGQGIGKALLTALISAAEAAGFLQMLAVIGGGEPASVALHAALGFHHAGRMQAVGYKFDRWLDTVYMQRPLGQVKEALS